MTASDCNMLQQFKLAGDDASFKHTTRNPNEHSFWSAGSAACEAHAFGTAAKLGSECHCIRWRKKWAALMASCESCNLNISPFHPSLWCPGCSIFFLSLAMKRLTGKWWSYLGIMSSNQQKIWHLQVQFAMICCYQYISDVKSWHVQRIETTENLSWETFTGSRQCLEVPWSASWMAVANHMQTSAQNLAGHTTKSNAIPTSQLLRKVSKSLCRAWVTRYGDSTNAQKWQEKGRKAEIFHAAGTAWAGPNQKAKSI